MNPTILALILTTGTLLGTGPADYNAVSGYGTRLSGGAPLQTQFVDTLPELDGLFLDLMESEVHIQNIALASEVDEGNGFTRLGFTLTLNNTGPGYYEECFIEWEPVNDTWHGVQVGDLMVESAYVYKLTDLDAIEEDQHLREVITAAEAVMRNPDGTANVDSTPQVTQILKVLSKSVAMDGKVHLITQSVALEDFLSVGTLQQGSKQALDLRPDLPIRNIYRPALDIGVLSAVDPIYTGGPPLFLQPELPKIRSPKRLFLALRQIC